MLWPSPTAYKFSHRLLTLEECRNVTYEMKPVSSSIEPITILQCSSKFCPWWTSFQKRIACDNNTYRGLSVEHIATVQKYVKLTSSSHHGHCSTPCHMFLTLFSYLESKGLGFLWLAVLILERNFWRYTWEDGLAALVPGVKLEAKSLQVHWRQKRKTLNIPKHYFLSN